MSARSLVNAFFQAYLANDLDAMFDYVDPRVMWVLNVPSFDEGNNVYSKDQIQDLWERFADPNVFRYVERQVDHLVFDETTLERAVFLTEFRGLSSGAVLPLQVSWYFRVSPDNTIIAVENYGDREQFALIEQAIQMR